MIVKFTDKFFPAEIHQLDEDMKTIKKQTTISGSSIPLAKKAIADIESESGSFESFKMINMCNKAIELFKPNEITIQTKD